MRSIILFLHPLTLVWLLLGGWVAWLAWRKQWRQALIPGLVWTYLTLLSCTPAATLLLASLESRVPAVSLDEIPQADAIVCLGGGAGPSRTEPAGIHMGMGAERLATSLVLLRQGRAPVLVLGGGGHKRSGEKRMEAELIISSLGQLGLETAAMLPLGICTDTHDEAVKTAALMRERGWKKILLVTSASHMPRAAAVFEKAGVPVVAVPCGYVSTVSRVEEFPWIRLPHLEWLGHFGNWLHEMAGLLYYRWRGWI